MDGAGLLLPALCVIVTENEGGAENCPRVLAAVAGDFFNLYSLLPVLSRLRALGAGARVGRAVGETGKGDRAGVVKRFLPLTKAGEIVKFCFCLKQDLSVKPSWLVYLYVICTHLVKPSKYVSFGGSTELGNLRSSNKELHDSVEYTDSHRWPIHCIVGMAVVFLQHVHFWLPTSGRISKSNKISNADQDLQLIVSAVESFIPGTDSMQVLDSSNGGA